MPALKNILPALLLSGCGVLGVPSFEPFIGATSSGGAFYGAGSGQCLDITRNPVSQTAVAGGTATLNVAAQGTPPLSCQWQHDGADLTDGSSASGKTITGSTTTNLLISGAGYGDAENYSVAIRNAQNANVVSPDATLKAVNTNIVNPIDYLNVKAYGAKGDGITDDTAAFLAAIAAAESQHLNGVYVPGGKYVISSTLTLNASELIGRFSGGWPAKASALPTLLIRQYTAPGLSLLNGASLHGIAIDYDQGTPDNSNAPAISVQGIGTVLSNLRIQNAYDAITSPRTAQPGRARYSDILIVQPAHVGVEISKCYDFVQYHDIEVICPGARSTGAAFRFGRVDEGSYSGLVASNCAIGLEFFTDTDTNGGTFTGGFAGCSAIACGTDVSAIGNHKIIIVGGHFTASDYGAVIDGTNAQVIILGGEWRANSGQAIQVKHGENVLIDGNEFSRARPVSSPLVQIENCNTVTVEGCQFLPDSTGLALDSQVQRAVVYGNSFEAGGIVNHMSSPKSVLADNLATANPPMALIQNGQGIILQWPAWAGNYSVYAAAKLNPPITWEIITNAAQSNNGAFYLSLPLANAGQQFYRLFGP